MAWTKTGWRRSLKLSVLKQEPTHPEWYPDTTTVYDGQSGFTYNGTTWAPLTNIELAQLPSTGTTGWDNRLTAFKARVISINPYIKDSNSNPIIGSTFWNGARVPVDITVTFSNTGQTSSTYTVSLTRTSTGLPYIPTNTIRVQFMVHRLGSDSILGRQTVYNYIPIGSSGHTFSLTESDCNDNNGTNNQVITGFTEFRPMDGMVTFSQGLSDWSLPEINAVTTTVPTGPCDNPYTTKYNYETTDANHVNETILGSVIPNFGIFTVVDVLFVSSEPH